MKLRSNKRSSLPRAVLPAAVLGTLMMSGSAAAFQIDTGNPDVDVRWDNTVRYNLGVRAENCDVNICGNGTPGVGNVVSQQSDNKFSKAGNVITDRVDLLSEFDFIYKKDTGFRVSAAAWYDAAYSNRVAGNPGFNAFGPVAQGAGPTGGPYNSYTNRYVVGPSGEILDAFVFTKFNLGNMPVNVKLGQHNLYWGESLFSFVNGVAYNQGPVDLQKAIAAPGIDAKEVFLPLPQFSFSAQPTPELTLMGQYLFDWKPSRLPEGGTYFGAADGISLGGTGSVFGIPVGIIDPKQKRGNFGLAAKWRPEWLDGTMGFYYREYTNKFPQLVATPTGFDMDFASAKREKMLGFSLSKELAGISWGADLTYRPNAVLEATPFSTFVPAGADPSSWVPTGNVSTALVNAIKLFGKTPLFDMATLIGELTYSRLNSVTANGANYFGQGYGCTDSSNPTMHACPTKSAWGLSLKFEPTWYQVRPGIDLSAPIFYHIGLKGNSPVLFGDNQGEGSYSLGVSADVDSKYKITLQYNGFKTRHANDQLGAAGENNSSLGNYWDRNWVSLTFKTSF